jgi:hypothetical protein
MFSQRTFSSAILMSAAFFSSVSAAPIPKAGVAKTVITPSEYIWMAGYAARNKPAEGKQHDLFAKVIAIEDTAGKRLVFVGTDLIGLPRSISADVAAEVTKRTGLPRENLMLTSSHTHCGPVLRDNLMDMYDLTPDMREKVRAYSQVLRKKLVDVIVAALDDLKPAQLHYGRGTARFAVNRRQPTEKGMINGRNDAGPVDHSVPVLRVTEANGKLRAAIFGYACHNTTLSFYDWCGDYAGFAQAELEAKFPEMVALYWIGCGGDANPLPRGTVELCKKYGKELAGAVSDIITRTEMKPLQGDFSAKYSEIAIPFGSIPDRAQWTADAKSTNFALRTRAGRFLKMLDAGEKVPDQYPHYPVQVWRLGDVTWIALGGEVVIDYNLRLTKELGADRPIWITGYANDVMAYIPSVRVLREGGYEADSSMIYYGMPTKWGERVEELIVGKVKELAR